MYYTKKVRVYDVNGYMVCVKEDGSEQELNRYLEEVPEELIKNRDYIGESYVVLTKVEAEGFTVKELQHMKINKLFNTDTMAELFKMAIVEDMYTAMM